MISFFANIFGYVLNFIYNIIGNYGLAIIVFSILVKILMIPISIKQQKTMKKSTKLNAKLKELQVKYKNNPEKLNEETMALYKSENMNPLSVCLSAIVQIVLLFSVFFLVKSPLTYMKKVDNNVIEKYTQIMKQEELSDSNSGYPEIDLIREIENIKTLENKKEEQQNNNEEEKIDLSEINQEELDNLYINMDFFGLNLAQVPTKGGDWKSYIIPVLYVLISVLSMRIANSTMPKVKSEKKDEEEEFDPVEQMNKNMNLVFPIMYVMIALVAPLGLALYWLMNSLLMIVEKLTLNKLLKDEEE